MSRLEWCLAVAIVGFIAVLFIGMHQTSQKFEDECKRIGGKSLWDGRQYQCLKG